MNNGILVAALVAVSALCACTSTKKDESAQPATREVSQPTYKPTGSHIVERSDGRRSPKNSSTAPVQDVKDMRNAPAVTVIPNQPPK
jgi:hypothetical protein